MSLTEMIYIWVSFVFCVLFECFLLILTENGARAHSLVILELIVGLYILTRSLFNIKCTCATVNYNISSYYKPPAS